MKNFIIYIFGCLLICISLFSDVFSQNVVLNEIMASNNATIADEDGDYPDWIEIYNSGDEPVNLSGFGLSDDYDNPFRWVFPDTTIGTGEFMLIWASNKNSAEPGRELHTNFAIASEGEEILLTHPDNIRIDELPPTEIPTDISIGRQPDGAGDWVYFDEPTPGAPNTTQSISELLDPPVLSHQPGFYTSSFDLDITHTDPDVILYFTTDGSEPTNQSEQISGPIFIYDRSGLENTISEIPTNYIRSPSRFRWRNPAGTINKATVIRVAAFKDGTLPSKLNGTFFIFDEGADKYDLPVISISTGADNLFDEKKGIYVPGINKIAGNELSGNYFERGYEWEREASFEFFNERGEIGISQNIGIRIHGGVSRRYPKKSLRLYARSEYGQSRFNYSIFLDSDHQEYNRLILRNSGQDFGRSLIMDPVAQSLVRHLDFDTQAYRPAILFLNGEYWGIKNIRERYDRHYLERVYGIDPDNIDLLTSRNTVKEGDAIHYNQMISFVENHDLSINEHFEHLKTLIDLNNFIDYFASQIYFGNDDWPHNNIDFWRLKVPFDPNLPKGHDGRWRWLMFDVDRSMEHNTGPSYNIIEKLTEKYGENGREWPNLLFRNLLDNNGFKNDLINRITDLLNTAFLPHRVSSVIDSLKLPLDNEIEEYIHRWNEPRSKNWWNDYIDDFMHNYAEDRPEHLRQHIKNHWPVGEEVPLTVDVSNPDRGYIQINRTDLLPSTPGISSEPYPWTGIYFSDISVTLSVHEYSGFRFSHWVAGDEQFFQKQITFTPGEINHITAVFEERLISEIEPYPVSDGLYLFSEWDDDEPADTFPESMGFVFMGDRDPGLDSPVSGLTFGAYNHNSRTRITGLGEDGFSFINTSNPDGNPGYPGTRLGGAILVLDTRNVTGVEVGFEAGTIRPNSRVYNLRLQYRIGSEGEFQDLLDEDGEPFEYLRNEEEGHSEFIGPAALPEDAIGQERIELLWRYYHTGEQLDEDVGQRTKLNISAIHVTETKDVPISEPHILTNNPYEFSNWPADAPAGSAPPHMAFVYMDLTDPGPDAGILGYTSGAFDHESQTRINGLGEDGFAFINTSNLDGNSGYPGRRLGGALLLLNSEGQGSISVEWTGGTVLSHSRIYNLRLQYRTDANEPFRDVLDSFGNPVEYHRNEEDGHQEAIGPVLLPPDAEDQSRIELLWRYYYNGERLNDENGERAMLNISSIVVSSMPLLGSPTGPPQEFKLFQNYPNPFYPHSIIRYDLPSDQHVRIDLYSITGRHIATLEERHARAGRHSVEVDASALASGIYFYRFRSDDFSDTGKMSVIK